MPDDDEPKQTTPKGLKIPIPKREDFLANLKKTAPKVESDEGSTSDGAE
jgi:hypothetical protein